MLLIVALAQATAAMATAPGFSWETVPVFQQLCDVNGTLDAEMPAEKLRWLARWFPIVTMH
jgi:hypothetical protein